MSIGKTRLSIFGYGEHVGVCERPELMRYPQSCLERHITPSGAFCLGLELRRIVTTDDAADWWSDLHHFLVLQKIAEETGRWAAQHALSHGQKAAEHEIRARHLASKLDIEDDYNRAVDGEANWLARAVDGEPIPDAPKNKTMRELLRLERARRNAVEGVWRYQFAQGAKCCGTMKDCRLRDLEGAASAARGPLSPLTRQRAGPSSVGNATVASQADDATEARGKDPFVAVTDDNGWRATL